MSVEFARHRALFGSFVVVAACLLVRASGAGAQPEPVLCFGETATIVGTGGRDHLKGTSGRDVIQALGGKDVVDARGGDDVVCGDLGDDRLSGGRGDDLLHDENGDDRLDGGHGNDRLYGNYGDDEIRGGAGDDQLLGGNGDDEDITPGRDRMSGGSGDDLLDAGQGDDRLDGGAGDDTLRAGPGETRDRLSGGRGADQLEGSFGPDRLDGGSGADFIDGDAGDDLLRGGRGDDELFGRAGDDRLEGGPGDDLLNGGEGVDRLRGGPGRNRIVDDTLGSLVGAGDRGEIRSWAGSRSIATINAEVAALSAAERDRLAEVVLDTNATGADRDKMLRVMRNVLGHSELGFYAEIWSYTLVELTGNGFFGTCNHLFLSPDAWAGLSDQDATGILMHESFHSFNCVNGGPAGSLDEGSAIWVITVGLNQEPLPGQSLAETTYGTKLYYKVFQNNPDFPLTAPLNPSAKLIDVYEWLSATDPSKLPWNSTERLVTCFDRYFADLDRNVDFFAVWLPAVEKRTDLMLADAECKPL